MFNSCIWKWHKQKGKLMRSDCRCSRQDAFAETHLNLLGVKLVQNRTGIYILWKWKLLEAKLAQNRKEQGLTSCESGSCILGSFFWLARGPAEFWCEATGFLGQAGFKRWRGDRVVGSSLTQSKVHTALLGLVNQTLLLQQDHQWSSSERIRRWPSRNPLILWETQGIDRWWENGLSGWR